MNKITSIRANVVVLKQMLNLIPRGMINRHALATGVEAKARTFTGVSHLSAMLFAQLICTLTRAGSSANLVTIHTWDSTRENDTRPEWR